MRAWLALAVVAGCNPYDRDLGQTPFLCGETEPRCPKDYSCMTDPATGADVCFASGANTFACADDSAHEPNESFQMAMPLDSAQITGLAICPAGDIDTFSFDVAEGQTIELIVTFEADAATLMGAILNPAGAPSANATPDNSMPDTIRALAPSVTAGTYFVSIAGPRKGINNYELTVNLTGP